MESEINQFGVNADVPLRVDQLRVAGILDELSEKFFPFECKFVNLNANAWEKQINELNPHFLFVESVWNGYQKTWRGKLSYPPNNLQLIKLVNWCKERKIPTIFWNKEDPIHMFTFLGTAFLFDYVFTTDMDCVPLYKRLLGHNRVGVLPFATAIQLFNPIETYPRKDAACFAGSYYSKREERRIDFESIADTLIKNYALEIYDRNAYPGNPDYSFPERFKPYIKGTLPVDEIDIAYKGYKLGITLNIVKHSSTMEARRIFELLGCNTLTLSNPCLGIKNLFGDLILYYENSDEFPQKLKNILSNESYSQRLRLLALRKVLQEHTYKERLEYLYTKIYNNTPQNISPQIAVFSLIKNRAEAKRIQMTFDRQNYKDKQLFLFTYDNSENSIEIDKSIHPINQFHTILDGKFDYYAYFSPQHYYGENYLVDLALSTRYAYVSAIGKSAHYSKNGKNIVYQEDLGAYRLIDRIKADRAMFSAHLLPIIDPNNHFDELWFENMPCLSIDPFNFCANHKGQSCDEVDDLNINCGVSIEDLYRKSNMLSEEDKNYSLGIMLTGKDLYKQAILKSNACRIELLPLSYFGFYSWGNYSQKIFIDKKILLQGMTTLNELTGEPILYVYINGNISGQISFYINYYDENDKFLGSYLIFNRTFVTLPVPEIAQNCRLSITCQGESQGLVKEVIINPQICSAIDLM